MKDGLFSKESHYGWTACAIAVSYVLYMSYLFPKEWADTPNALAFIERMAHVIPSLNNLMQYVPPYTNFWGMFYAIFWAISPSFLILGFASAFFLPDEKNKNMMLASHGRFLGMFWISVAASLYLWLSPFAGSVLIPFSNQFSNFIPFRITAWGLIVGMLYLSGMVFGVCYRRFTMSIHNKKEKR